jgi:hypothetical protein
VPAGFGGVPANSKFENVVAGTGLPADELLATVRTPTATNANTVNLALIICSSPNGIDTLK